MKNAAWILFAALALAACDNSVDAGSDPGSTGGSGASGGGTSAPGLCSAASPCPDGLFCFNGLCAIGCQTNGDCADDQYCDTSEFGDRLCHNKQVTVCPQTECASTQVCVNGLCSTPPSDGTCNPDGVMTGQDGCDSHAVCLADESENASCYSFPPCAEDGSCPVGIMGATCNDGYIPNKARICLLGLCEDAGNCPSGWVCVKPTANSPIGACSSGGTGMSCTNNAECASNNCVTAAPGMPGVCM